MNGLLAADHAPHPGAGAHKWLQRYVHVEPADLKAGSVKIRNRFDFTTIGDAMTGHWKIEANGKPMAEGTIADLAIAPREEKTVITSYSIHYTKLYEPCTCRVDGGGPCPASPPDS